MILKCYGIADTRVYGSEPGGIVPTAEDFFCQGEDGA
jgi:hypothetical protein